jgi:hypothetical protein
MIGLLYFFMNDALLFNRFIHYTRPLHEHAYSRTNVTNGKIKKTKYSNHHRIVWLGYFME